MKQGIRWSALIAVALAGTAGAQGYPAKNVVLVIPYPPGGGTDLFGRLLASDMAQQLGRQIIVENRSGAAGNIGAEHVAKAAPDGHTLLYTASQMAVSKALGASLRYDPQRDLKPVSMTISIPLVLVVHPSLPVKNVKGLIALAKSQPGALTYSSSGAGASGHLTMALLNTKTGIDTRHVPYRGAAPSLTSVISGETQMSFLVPPIVQPHVAGGKLRAIAVSSRQRSSVFPNVATVEEQGVRDYEALQWHGFYAPAGTPDAIVAQLHAAVVKALARPEMKARFIAEGANPVGSSPGEFAKFFQEEIAKWAEVAKRAGIKAQ